jgi:hypothetical protein
MLWLLALSLLSAATLGSVLAYQRPARGESHATERTLQTLRPGDVVVFGDDDWLITSTATYREEEDTWWVHVLEDGAVQRLMEVRERERWTVTLLEPAHDVPTFGSLGLGLTFRAQPFRLARRGDARVSVDGTGSIKAGLIRYATYSGPGGAHLNVEERDEQRFAFAGEEVAASGLMLMPGEAPTEDPLADLA